VLWGRCSRLQYWPTLSVLRTPSLVRMLAAPRKKSVRDAPPSSSVLFCPRLPAPSLAAMVAALLRSNFGRWNLCIASPQLVCDVQHVPAEYVFFHLEKRQYRDAWGGASLGAEDCLIAGSELLPVAVHRRQGSRPFRYSASSVDHSAPPLKVRGAELW